MASQKTTATPTLISKGCTIEGKIESDVFIRIDGLVKGEVYINEGIIVGELGNIEGNLNAREAVIYGTVIGTIKADSIQIKSTGKIQGELHTNNLQVEKGAIYIGNIYMDKFPSKKEITAV
jgi:cytoskeletal protein CcmA (bactofilin family)